MNLLELPSGMMSLEYADTEQAVVRARLDSIGEVSVADHLTYAEVKVGGESLIHITDWDEPCLIAQSDVGNAILRRIFDSGIDITTLAAE